MTVHILNGDELIPDFKRAEADGDMIIFRDNLLEGPVKAEGVFAFWNGRADFHWKTQAEEAEIYYKRVRSEVNKIERLPQDTEINLWFENDISSQVNMWFIMHLLNKSNLFQVYRINPQHKGLIWRPFEKHTSADLRICYHYREIMTKGDFRLGECLWNAYSKGNMEVLQLLSQSISPCFPFLNKAGELEELRKEEDFLNKKGRPKQMIL